MIENERARTGRQGSSTTAQMADGKAVRVSIPHEPGQYRSAVSRVCEASTEAVMESRIEMNECQRLDELQEPTVGTLFLDIVILSIGPGLDLLFVFA